MEKREIETIVREVLAKLENTQNLSGQREAESNRKLFSQSNAESNRNLSQGNAGGLGRLTDGGNMGLTEPAVFPGLVEANGGKTHVTMPLALAVRLIGKIEAKAAEWDMRVVTAVSDAAGRPVAVHCMDGAYIGSFDVALNKTYTSIAFQMSTARLGSLSGPGESLYGIQFTNEGRIVIFGGGEVLEREGVIVGALGISGGSAEQDTALAAYGKSIFTELE